MAATFTPNTYAGTRYEEYFAELILSNKTLAKNLVRFIPNIKLTTTVSTVSGDVTLQAYTSGAPSASGTFNVGDALLTPTKVMAYDEFDPEVVRQTAFSLDMPAGVRNMDSNKLNQIMLAWLQKVISRAAEAVYWKGFTAATKAAIALAGNSALTTAGEKTFAAAQTSTLIDGVVAKLILDSTLTDIPTVLVAGATLTATNLVAELLKVYAAIPTEVIENVDQAIMFCPYSVKKFVNQANNAALYRDLIVVNGESVSFLGVRMEFVPLKDNVITVGVATDYLWGTDLTADYGQLEVNKIALNQDKMFYKNVFAQVAGVCVPFQKVLYFS